MGLPSVIVVIGGTLIASLSADEIGRFVEANRTVGDGAGIILAQRRADLNADGVDDGVLLFTYQIGESQNRNHTQYLVAFLSGDVGFTASKIRIVGGKLNTYWDKIELDQENVWLLGRKYLSDDAACCPTGYARVRYVVSKGELVEVEGQWTRTE